MKLSPSIAKILIQKSPIHAWQAHHLGGGSKSDPTSAMIEGRLIDALILGGESKIQVLPFKDYKTDAAKEAKAEALKARKVPVLEGKFAEAKATADILKVRIREFGYDLGACEFQKRLEWTDSKGVECCGVLDALDTANGLIFDLKTCDDATPYTLQRKIPSYGYDIQSASYIEAVSTTIPELQGRLKMIFLFCELEPPFAVLPVEFSGTMATLGSRRWKRAKRTWAKCLESKVWTGYSKEPVKIEALPWQLSQEQEQGGDDNGYPF